MKRVLVLLTGRLAHVPALAVLACLAQGLGGCDLSGGTGGGSVENSIAGLPTSSFLERIANAPMTVAFGGKRHVKLEYSVDGVSTDLEYEEQVWSDGQGKFSIVPGAVAQPTMTAEQLDLFQAMQQARDGFFYRYRDFRIRDLPVFLQNWSVTDTGRQERVAGLMTSVFEFRRIDGTPTWYRAWIDPQTALVLRAEERGAGNRLASSVRFLTFQLSPDTSGLGLQDDQYVRTPVDPASDTTGTLGFQIRPPTLLPDGYRLERAESTDDGTNQWVIFTYTDGVDSIFFMQTFDPQAQSGQSPPGEYDVGPKVARGYRFGPWTVLQLRSNGDRVLVIGKADSFAIERMLKSSMR